MIFVFGSNTGGIHGGGAALAASKFHGAVWNVGYGHTNNSFAIPTKGVNVDGKSMMIGDPLPLERIQQFVDGFIAYAKERPDLQFQVTRIGCGLAGFTDKEIAPMFHDAPKNCLFDDAWKPWFGEHAAYWGTF